MSDTFEMGRQSKKSNAWIKIVTITMASVGVAGDCDFVELAWLVEQVVEIDLPRAKAKASVDHLPERLHG